MAQPRHAREKQQIVQQLRKNFAFGPQKTRQMQQLLELFAFFGICFHRTENISGCPNLAVDVSGTSVVEETFFAPLLQVTDVVLQHCCIFSVVLVELFFELSGHHLLAGSIPKFIPQNRLVPLCHHFQGRTSRSCFICIRQNGGFFRDNQEISAEAL